jgi:oxalate decarboxylase
VRKPARSFGAPAASFGHTPDPGELYIFPAPIPGPLSSDKIAGATPAQQTFSHRMMALEPIRTKSGTVRIPDSSVLPGSRNFAHAVAPRVAWPTRRYAMTIRNTINAFTSCEQVE